MERALEEWVRRRAGGRCEYCRVPQARDRLPFEIDHVIARKHRGPTTLKNTCWACANCNGAKGSNAAGFDPRTDKLVRLFNPRTDRWAEHFHADLDRAEIVGLTPTGRATVACLAMNDPQQVTARALWIQFGVFLP